jgi:hypothetical protein
MLVKDNGWAGLFVGSRVTRISTPLLWIHSTLITRK